MPLSRKEIEALMLLVANTEDSEINCEHCLSVVAEFAEQQLAGKTTSQGIKAVEQHLSICVECREEYELLLSTMVEWDGRTDNEAANDQDQTHLPSD